MLRHLAVKILHRVVTKTLQTFKIVYKKICAMAKSYELPLLDLSFEDEVSFSCTRPEHGLFKRIVIRIIERCTGQPRLKKFNGVGLQVPAAARISSPQASAL